MDALAIIGQEFSTAGTFVLACYLKVRVGKKAVVVVVIWVKKSAWES